MGQGSRITQHVEKKNGKKRGFLYIKKGKKEGERNGKGDRKHDKAQPGALCSAVLCAAWLLAGSSGLK